MEVSTKALHPSDYELIQPAVAKLHQAHDFFLAQGCRIDIGHEHRFWEYGMAMEVARECQTGRTLLDVGSGNGLFGPAMAYNGWNVTEVDADTGVMGYREKLQQVLREAHISGTLERIYSGFGFGSLPEGQWDVVSCISVLEHLPPEVEQQAWVELAGKVCVGGLLLVTVDCMPQREGYYVFDDLRKTRFTVDDIRRRVEMLTEHGMGLVGQASWKWNGNFVHDYSFFLVSMRKLS